MKILGIGVDIVKNKRFKTLIKNKFFLSRTFSQNEIKTSKNISNKINYFSKRFAAKEALAKSLGTPSSSNIIRPGLTRHTQNSGDPLPLPILTSAGLLETGTSGKMRIQTLPARLICRVMARLAASI